MPKIVNKEEKRKEIIVKAYELILKDGVKSFSTDALIKYMGIGKSSLYNYFKSKEEIFYSVYFYSGDDYLFELEKKVDQTKGFKQKLEVFYSFYLVDIVQNPHLKDFYQHYLFIALENKTPQMLEYNALILSRMQQTIQTIFKEAIDNGEIKKEALAFSETLLENIDGMFLYSCGLENYNLQKKVQNFIDNFVQLVEVKK